MGDTHDHVVKMEQEDHLYGADDQAYPHEALDQKPPAMGAGPLTIPRGPVAVSVQRTVNLYDLEKYTLGKKEAQLEKDTSVAARLARMKDIYEREGMRRTVDAVLLVHQHNHPHVLLLQIGNTFYKLCVRPPFCFFL